MSTNTTNASSPAASHKEPTLYLYADVAAGGPDKKPAAQETVTKTVQTVEVRSSAGQPDEEGVLKPVEVVHEIPAKEAKDSSGVKQD